MNPEERACAREDGPICKYLEPGLCEADWCGNMLCCQHRGTAIPGIANCPYYEPYYEPGQEEKDWNDLCCIVAITAFGVTVGLLTLFIIEALSGVKL